jgi:transposase-like protein
MKLIEEFGTHEECRQRLEELRWPNGVKCPLCQSERISRIRQRQQFDCNSCSYQFSVTAGTLFNDTHLPLPTWFAAVYLMCEVRKGVSANKLKGILGVSYKTAWCLCHRIRTAMREANSTRVKGTVGLVRGNVPTSRIERVPRLLRRLVVGPRHHVSAKHLDKYINEFEFRLNNPKNPYLVRDTLLQLLHSDALPYRALVG